MRHQRSETPAYLVWVEHAPTDRGKGKESYLQAVRRAAGAVIATPIESNDIEVEVVYATTRPPETRKDADNINKPTLDALKGVAHLDDRQVRVATGIVFDKGRSNQVNGRVEYVSRLFYSTERDVLLILIYSDSRLRDLGGEAEVQRRRYEDWQREFNRTVAEISRDDA
jgi:hypothetical protein